MKTLEFSKFFMNLSMKVRIVLNIMTTVIRNILLAVIVGPSQSRLKYHFLLAGHKVAIFYIL